MARLERCDTGREPVGHPPQQPLPDPAQHQRQASGLARVRPAGAAHRVRLAAALWPLPVADGDLRGTGARRDLVSGGELDRGRTDRRTRAPRSRPQGGSAAKARPSLSPVQGHARAPVRGAGHSRAGWVHQEFGGAKLGDRRLQTRLFDLATAFFARPGASLPQALGTAGAKAAYRFFDHEHTTLEALLEPHRLATLARMRREAVVLVVQETLSLDYTTHRALQGIGPIGTEAGGGQGVMLQTTLAFSADGLPLGTL